MTLRRHYTYQVCSPTRSALLSGRLPHHVNEGQSETTHLGGIDLRMETITERLKRGGGWTCAGAGKWHAGGYLAGQTPTARGMDKWLGFLNGKEDHVTQLTNDLGGPKPFPVDLWSSTPVGQGGGSGSGSPAFGQNGTYSAAYISSFLVDAVRAHAARDAAAGQKLFVLAAFQNTHVPLQVPAPRMLNTRGVSSFND